jgi:pimeloyl-ACP methyl ester carboxylesterase
VLDHLGIQRATLMGHSMGVQVILTAAHQHPERTVALVPMCGAFEKPLDTFQGSDVGSKLLPFLTGAALRYQVGLRKLWQRWVPTELAYQLAVATEINPKMIRRDDFLPYLTHMARLDPLVFLAFLQSAAHHSAREWLPQLQIPALVVAGLRDHFTPGRLQAELVQLLPDAELLEIPGGSHTAPLELPELIELRLELWSRARGLGLI